MKNIGNAAFAAAILLVCVPAAAQERATVSAPVTVADLNLTTKAGLATYRTRVRGTARRLCGEASRDLRLVQDSRRCLGEVIASGEQQMTMMLASGARPQQLRLAAR